MPMRFTDEVVDSRLKMAKLEPSGTSTEKRERLATFIENKFKDYVEGWEIRTGKPWDEMTPEEADELILQRPHLIMNPGMQSILIKRMRA